jgi:hypothetical protein
MRIVPAPVEVLSGVPFDQAERALALLRGAGIPVGVRRVVEGRWLYVAPVDEARALELLAAHRFPPPMAVGGATAVVRPATGAAPGDDVWELLLQDDPPWPSVYSFP